MKKFTKPADFGFEMEEFLLPDEQKKVGSAIDAVTIDFDVKMTGLKQEYEKLYQFCSQLYNKANKKGDDFVLISEPDFTVSFIEEKPLFDGSDETDEFFTVDTYQNYTLFESRSIPTSFLKNHKVSIVSDSESDNPSDFFPEQQAVDPTKIDS